MLPTNHESWAALIPLFITHFRSIYTRTMWLTTAHLRRFDPDRIVFNSHTLERTRTTHQNGLQHCYSNLITFLGGGPVGDFDENCILRDRYARSIPTQRENEGKLQDRRHIKSSGRRSTENQKQEAPSLIKESPPRGLPFLAALQLVFGSQPPSLQGD